MNGDAKADLGIREEWRRERDSNPRYGFPYSGFQDRPFQPLTHPSGPGPQQFTSRD
jgi:site-specific DNA recombinase